MHVDPALLLLPPLLPEPPPTLPPELLPEEPCATPPEPSAAVVVSSVASSPKGGVVSDAGP